MGQLDQFIGALVRAPLCLEARAWSSIALANRHFKMQLVASLLSFLFLGMLLVKGATRSFVCKGEGDVDSPRTTGLAYFRSGELYCLVIEPVLNYQPPKVHRITGSSRELSRALCCCRH